MLKDNQQYRSMMEYDIVYRLSGWRSFIKIDSHTILEHDLIYDIPVPNRYASQEK